MNWFRKTRQFFSSEESTNQSLSRRQFFTGMGGIAIGAGLLLPDEAWAGVEERARQFSIEPGTVVDAQGRPMTSAALDTPILGAIVMFGFNFPPRGWAECSGQLLSISSNSALFALLGTIYGGDGRVTFALPDLRGRFAMHYGSGPGLSPRNLGERSGSESSTLGSTNLPAHTHAADEVLVRGIGTPQSTGLTNGQKTGAASTGSTGNGQPFNNMPPFQAVNFCIALQGIFPSRN